MRMFYRDGGAARAYGLRLRRPQLDRRLSRGRVSLPSRRSRLTRVDIGQQARMLRVTDDAIFDYPWLYAVEVGRWDLDETEAARLREYLDARRFPDGRRLPRHAQWQGFVESMQRVFPDRPIVEIAESDEVFHVLYDLDQRIQIPGIAALHVRPTYEEDGVTPHWRGIYDDDGRLMVAINFNMDLGDAWEHADDPRYPEPKTTLAYRFAVNYVVYAMTH